MYMVSNLRKWGTKRTKGDQQRKPNDTKRTKEQITRRVNKIAEMIDIQWSLQGDNLFKNILKGPLE